VTADGLSLESARGAIVTMDELGHKENLAVSFRFQTGSAGPLMMRSREGGHRADRRSNVGRRTNVRVALAGRYSNHLDQVEELLNGRNTRP
jgi:hypothetical protein